MTNDEGRLGFLEIGDNATDSERRPGSNELPIGGDVPEMAVQAERLPTAEELAREALTLEDGERPDVLEFGRTQSAHQFSHPGAWVANMPTLHEFRQYLDQHAATRRDFTVPLRGMQVSNDAGHVYLGWRQPGDDQYDEPTPWPITMGALESFGARVDCPGTVTRWMLTKGHADVCSDVLQRQAHRAGMEDPDRTLLVRARANNGTRYVRGVLSDKYVPLDCDLVFGALDDIFIAQSTEAGLQETRLAALSYTGDSVRAVLAYPDAYFVEPGDSGYMPVTVVTNNEIGGGSVKLQFGMARSVCTNLVVMGFTATVEGIKQRHVGRIDGPRLKADIAQSLEQGFQFSAEIGDRIRAAKEIPVPNVANMVVLLARTLKMPRSIAGRWMGAYRNEAMVAEASRGTAFGVAQGLSRLARAYTSDRRHELEVAAGSLLGGNMEANWRKYVDRAEDLDTEEVVVALGGQAQA